MNIYADSIKEANWDLLWLPSSIEIARVKGNGPKIPDDLETSYRGAWEGLPDYIPSIARRSWDNEYCIAVLVALAVAKGHPDIAECISELTPDIMPDFMEWVQNR